MPRSTVSLAFVVALCLALGLALGSPGIAQAAPWLFVSDIHLDPHERRLEPAHLGSDTNEALLASAIAEMKRVDPDAPVVVIPGDFLGHHFDVRFARATMTHLARSFDRAFPHAQFVIALGNEDSACGDYGLGPGAAFLRETAAAWEPLVNRRGAAPDFARTFARDGFYTAALPGGGLRVVVLDDVFWSPRFRAACGVDGADPAEAALDDLARALPFDARGRAWVVFHVPPGVDAFSSVHLVHHLAVVPFLTTGPRNRLLAILGDRRRHVSLVVAGHTHKFGFRLVTRDGGGRIPILMVPALSPIFRNNPMFLTADVAADGSIRSVEEHAFDNAWADAGGSANLGLPAFSGPALLALRARLEGDAGLRAAFARLYDGGAPPEITADDWRGYVCAIDALGDSEYRHCLGERGFRFLTGRGVLVGGVVAAVTTALLLSLAVLAIRAVRARRPRIG